uniref:Keratin n=1 Tax=Pseudonaja textilis TaxID=8673 RepID=A0A670Z5J3_PSETE
MSCYVPTCTIPTCGGATTAASLGIAPGASVSCINQTPSSEIVIQPSPPPPVVVTIPGPILSASCDPVAVGGNTPCAAPGSGILGRISGLSRGLLGGRTLQGGRGNIASSGSCKPAQIKWKGPENSGYLKLGTPKL